MADNALVKARKSALVDQARMAEMVGVSNVTLCKREQSPESMPLKDVKVYYDNALTEGKQWIEEWVNSFVFGR